MISKYFTLGLMIFLIIINSIFMFRSMVLQTAGPIIASATALAICILGAYVEFKAIKARNLLEKLQKEQGIQ